MLKRWDSIYEAGRPKGPWFKWKRDPHLIDAVLMYAQRGHGKRSSFYSDYTFGVWTRGRGRRPRADPGRQGLFRLHRRGAEADRQVRPRQHRRALRPGALGARRPGLRPGARGRLRGPAALHPPQVRRRHALSPHQPHPLGQARPARPTNWRPWSGCWSGWRAGRVRHARRRRAWGLNPRSWPWRRLGNIRCARSRSSRHGSARLHWDDRRTGATPSPRRLRQVETAAP